MDAPMRRGNETLEERMRLMGFAVEFGMELTGDEEGVLWYLDDLDQFAIGSMTAETETCLFEFVAIGVVEFVAVAVALIDNKRAVQPRRFGSNG